MPRDYIEKNLQLELTIHTFPISDSQALSCQTACVWTVLLDPQILCRHTHQSSSKKSTQQPAEVKTEAHTTRMEAE